MRQCVCGGGSEDNFGKSVLSYHLGRAGKIQIINIRSQCLCCVLNLKDRNEVTAQLIVHFHFWQNASQMRPYIC